MADDLPLIAQVSNVSTLATIDQMEKLFGFMGKIKDIRMYPSITVVQPQFKVCYIKYAESWSVRVALHLTNTVFIDRALVVVAIPGDTIPSEDSTSFDLLNPASALPGLLPSNFKDVSNDIAAVDGNLVITSVDTNLDILGLPQYPPLSADQDPNTIEEIRRTVFVENISPQVTASQLLDFINNVVGEVKYLRMAGHDKSMAQSAFVEFTDRASIVKALQCDGITLKGSKLKIQHSNSAIVKPQKDADVISEKDNEEAMKRLKEAESLIARVVEPEISGKSSRSRRRSSSRSRRRSSSRSRRRSRSTSRRSHKRDKRSHSKERRRRSLSRKRRSRSRSKVKRSRSRSRVRRSRSHSKSRRSKRSDRSYSRSRRSRSKRSNSKSKRSSRRSKSKSPHVRRKLRSPSPKTGHSKHGRSRSRSIISATKRRSRSRSRLSRSRRSRSRSKGFKHGKQTSSKGDSSRKERSRSRSKASAGEMTKNSNLKENPSRSRSREPFKPSDEESKEKSETSMDIENSVRLSEKVVDDFSIHDEGTADNTSKLSEDLISKGEALMSNDQEQQMLYGKEIGSEDGKTDKPDIKGLPSKQSEASSPRKIRSWSKERKGTLSPSHSTRRRHSYSSSSSSSPVRHSRDKKLVSRRRSRSPRRSSKRSYKRSISPPVRRSKRSPSPLKRMSSSSKYRSHDGKHKSRYRRSSSRSPGKRSKSRSPRRSVTKDTSCERELRVTASKKESLVRGRKASCESDARCSDSE